jgi:hypothetical protein
MLPLWLDSWLLRTCLVHRTLLLLLLRWLILKENTLRLFSWLLVDKHLLSVYVLLSSLHLLLRWTNTTSYYLLCEHIRLNSWYRHRLLILKALILLSWHHWLLCLVIASWERISEWITISLNLFWICGHNSVNLLRHVSFV